MGIVVVPSFGADPVSVTAPGLDAKVDGLATEFNGNIDNDNIKSGAGIGYAKLNLTGLVRNADIKSDAAIVDTKLDTIATAGKVNTTALVTTSQAAGDILYNDGTKWVRLAKDAGKYLLSGASAVSWETLAVGAAATQTNMEAASDNTVAVTPLSTKWHPGVAKGWVNFNGSGTPTIVSSYNVDASITDNGTGDYTISWTTDFSSAGYAVSGMAQHTASNSAELVSISQAANPAAGTIRILVSDQNLAPSDSTKISLIAFGDQ